MADTLSEKMREVSVFFSRSAKDAAKDGGFEAATLYALYADHIKEAAAELDRREARLTALEQETARLTAECKRLDNAVAEVWDNVHRVVQQAWVKPHDYDDSPLDLIAAVIDERDEAEQARDAAHAALTIIAECPPEAVHLMPLAAQAALAASAPQKEE